MYTCELSVQLLSQLLSATALTNLHWSGTSVSDQSTVNSSEQMYYIPQYRLQQQPQLSDLAHLSVLSIRVERLTAADIAPLSNLQRLQHLTLHPNNSSAWLYVEVADDSSDEDEDDPQPIPDHVAGPSQLLAALQHLTQLQYLSLQSMGLQRVGAQPQQQGDSYESFQALTASTQLTGLILVGGSHMPVPQATFAHMFPPGHVLPHLKVLQLTGDSCVGPAQIAMIAASCPALQELKLSGVTPEDFDSSCLAQLPSCITQVGGLSWSRLETWCVGTPDGMEGRARRAEVSRTLNSAVCVGRLLA